MLLSYFALEQRMLKHSVEALVFSIGNALVSTINMFIVTFFFTVKLYYVILKYFLFSRLIKRKRKTHRIF